MKSSACGLTTAALALAAALSVSVVGPHRAYAAPSSSATQADSDLAITVLSPSQQSRFTGNKPIEVSAFYQGSDNNAISAIELYVDGSNAFTKRLDAPEPRGVISFLIDTSALSGGLHHVVVRAVATDAEVVSAKSSFVYVADVPAVPAEDNTPSAPSEPASPAANTDTAPELSYLSPAMDDKVSGLVKVMLKATETDGKSPYVSLFIDRSFKTLRNFPPYEYDWDTTSFTNGFHTIEAYGYNEDQNVGPAQVLRVFVNNPGGRTGLRTDLKDGPQPTSSSSSTHTMPQLEGVTRPNAMPYLPTDTSHKSASQQSAPTKPIQTEATIALPPRRQISSSPMRVAKLDPAGSQMTGSDLSAPWATTSGLPLGTKAVGPARRPSPLLSTDSGAPRSYKMRPMMFAKREELLDETGGLHPQSDLSDPFIPDTASPKPDSRKTQTPTTGFKPMPSSGVTSTPALAATAQPKAETPNGGGPNLITRDAHTVPISLTAPGLVKPTLNVVVKTTAVDIAAPIGKPQRLDIHVGTVPATKQIAAHVTSGVNSSRVTLAIHVPASAPRHKMAIHTNETASLMRANGQMRILYNHTTLRLDRPITPRSGVMFSPLRQIFEYQGGNLTWQRRTGQVHAQSETKDIFLNIGKKNATVNNQQTILELAPYLDDGRTMVPLSFLPLALDVNVRFDPISGHLLITTKN